MVRALASYSSCRTRPPRPTPCPATTTGGVRKSGQETWILSPSGSRVRSTPVVHLQHSYPTETSVPSPDASTVVSPPRPPSPDGVPFSLPPFASGVAQERLTEATEHKWAQGWLCTRLAKCPQFFELRTSDWVGTSRRPPPLSQSFRRTGPVLPPIPSGPVFPVRSRVTAHRRIPEGRPSSPFFRPSPPAVVEVLREGRTKGPRGSIPPCDPPLKIL